MRYFQDFIRAHKKNDTSGNFNEFSYNIFNEYLYQYKLKKCVDGLIRNSNNKNNYYL